MSLKHFHVFFIATALALLAFTAYWSGQHIAAGEDHGLKVLEAGSLLLFTAGIPYLGWFLRKSRNLG